MKKLQILIFTILFTLTFALSANATTATHRATVEKLLKLTRQDRIVEQIYPQIKQLALQQINQTNPSPEQSAIIEKYLTKIFDVMQAEMSWDKMKEDFIRLYMSVYTEKEVQDLITFYKTPTGQKTIEKMPLLMQQSMVISQKFTLNTMPKIQKIAEEMAAEIGKKTSK